MQTHRGGRNLGDASPDNTIAFVAAAGTAPPPVVITQLGYLFQNGALVGLTQAHFRGYDPAVTGQLSLAIGQTAYATPGQSPLTAALAHVEAASAVKNATTLIDLSFALPGQSLVLGTEAPTRFDIGISSSTAGLSAILAPLYSAVAGTDLGKLLKPIIGFGQGLLPSLDRNGGLPAGGTLGAKPYGAVSAGFSTSQSVTIAGVTSTSSQSGSVILNGATSAAAGTALTDTAGLLSQGSALLSDLESGNLLAAIPAGVATLASATQLTGAIGPLLTAAAQQGDPTLPAIKNVALDLNVAGQLGQTASLGLGTPSGLTETIGVHITADTFGAYALGKLLATIAPQLITDLQDQGTVKQPLDVLSQLAQGVSTLAKDASQGFAGLGNAGAVPSSTNQADISLQVTFGVTEKVGGISNTQLFTTDLQTNAQGFYDLGVAAQSAITDVLVGVFETQAGHEILQIGGDILSQIDHKLGASAAIGFGAGHS